MQITRINANLHKTQLPNKLNQIPAQEVDRFEPVKSETPFWRQCLNHGLATGAGVGLLSTAAAYMGPNSVAVPAISGGVMGSTICVLGMRYEGAFEGAFGGLMVGGMTAAASVPGMVFGYQGALAAAGGGFLAGIAMRMIQRADGGG
jgi:hypothetical protein